MSGKQEKRRRRYEKPKATKLTAEEAMLKLIDYTSRGDQGAKDLLELKFPEEARRLSGCKKEPA